ncbi:hypothetical protein ACG7TL_000526 [Trametes sanguinea]
MAGHRAIFQQSVVQMSTVHLLWVVPSAHMRHAAAFERLAIIPPDARKHACRRSSSRSDLKVMPSRACGAFYQDALMTLMLGTGPRGHA